VRLARVQFTLRRMMAALAVVALIVRAGKMMLLSATYRQRAAMYESQLLGATPVRMGPRERQPVPARSARHQWTSDMADKYRYAAAYTWLPVEPDPPEP
jgi:hypothetical protein